MESTVEKTTSETKISTKDMLYVFAVILILVACFDLVGNIITFGIFFGIFNDIIQVTEANESILNLFLNLGAQIGAIVGFSLLYKAGKIEPEEKTTPPGQHLLTTYLLHAMNIFLLFIIILPLDSVLKELGFTTDSPYDTIAPTAATINDPVFIILFFSVLAIGAPIWEELVFRRTLIPLFERRGMGQTWALVFSSLIFSLQHTPTDLYNGSAGFAIEHFFSTFFGGLLLGFLYLRTRNIIWPILFHSLTNSFALLGEFSDISLPGVGYSVLSGFMIYWTLIALGVGALASAYFFIKLLGSGRDEFKPFWIHILSETKTRSVSLLKFGGFLIIFVLISGVVPIFLDLFEEVLNPGTESELLTYLLIQGLFYVVFIAGLCLFVFNMNPISNPIFVSKFLEADWIKPVLRRPDFVPTVQTAQTAGKTQFCISCGNEILPSAKYCAFCGADLSFLKNVR